jgi:hypothetical protein
MSSTNEQEHQFNSWKEFLLGWAKSTEGELGDKNMQAFIDASKPSSESISERLSTIVEVPGALILGVGDGGKIVPLHNFKKLGGSLVRPDNKLFALKGVSHKAAAVVVDISSLLEGHQAKAARFTDIAGCSTIEELAELTEVSTRSHFLDCMRFVILPPCGTKSLLNHGEDISEMDTRD